jgi:2,5-furandicarboxylate decarboxylase 1
MGLDATRPLDAEDMKFMRIRVPGEDEVDLSRVVSAAPSGSRRKAIGG